MKKIIFIFFILSFNLHAMEPNISGESDEEIFYSCDEEFDQSVEKKALVPFKKESILFINTLVFLPRKTLRYSFRLKAESYYLRNDLLKFVQVNCQTPELEKLQNKMREIGTRMAQEAEAPALVDISAIMGVDNVLLSPYIDPRCDITQHVLDEINQTYE